MPTGLNFAFATMLIGRRDGPIVASTMRSVIMRGKSETTIKLF